MKYAIYGAGSLGTVMGAFLTKNGVEIELVNRNKSHIEALKANGAKIIGTIDMVVSVNAVYPDEMTDNYDIIFLMTKQLFNKEVVEFLKPKLSENGVIVTLQNGIPEPLIASIVGSNKTIGCTVEWGANLSEPGCIVLTSEPEALSFHMGKMEGITDEQFNLVKSVLEKMCPVHEEDNLLGARWSKLLINSTFSGLGTVIGGTFGDVISNKKAKEVAIRCMKECIDVGHATGVEFAPVQGKNITKLFYYKGGFKKKIAKLILPIAMKKHKNIIPSMLQDLRNNKPCEIDAINGIISEYSKKYNIKTPINDRIVEIVKKEQNKELPLDLSNINLFDDIL